MSKIINKSEAWQGHNRGEVETFIKEQIPDSEHVVVKIRGCEWDADNGTDKSASVTGGKVIVKAFNPATAENLPVQEYDIPAPVAGEKASVVELDIQHGLHYQIHSEVDGLGASFRLVFTSSLESREVYLWNCSLGVYAYGFSALKSSDYDVFQRMVPLINPDANADLSEIMDWDSNDDVYGDDGGDIIGILLSTAKSSFLLCPKCKADETLAWSKMNDGRNVPGLEEFYEIAGQKYTAAEELAKADFDGALNSDKILDALSEAPATLFAAQSPRPESQRYLPAAGELCLISQNKAAINSMISDFDHSDLSQIGPDWWWSSSAYSRVTAWIVHTGDYPVGKDNKNSNKSVLALSAVHFYFY